MKTETQPLTYSDKNKFAVCLVAHNGFKVGQRKKVDEDMVLSAPDYWTTTKIRKTRKLTDFIPLQNEVLKLRKQNAELLEGLKYARRFLNEKDVDVNYIDQILLKAQTK